MNNCIAIYPSSSNPPTWGHADILLRASKLYSKIYWAAATNLEKKFSFSLEERLAMMEAYVRHYQLSNVVVDHFEGATVRYAMEKRAQIILRGLRNTTDFHYELELATGNRGINKKIETVCMFAKPHFATISSSLVRELAMLGEKITQYVLPEVADMVYRTIKQP